MTITITPSPIRKSLRVECNPKRAFEVFTARMGAWWHPDHTLLKSPREAVILEPRAGGRWYERAVDGSEYCDDNDDLEGRPPWDPDYEGTPPPGCDWSVDWSKVPMPETPLCPSCAARLTGWQPPAGYVVTAIEHEPRCPELRELLRARLAGDAR